MDRRADHIERIGDDGYTVIAAIYTDVEVAGIIQQIEGLDTSRPTFRKTNDLFAIRQFLKGVPEISAAIFNTKLKDLISELFGDGYFVVKSIYFDKPEQSNWFVAWHQDLTISVDKKQDLAGYGPWTVKQDQFAVQPPIEILEDNFTIRIHLDDTDANNGALKVIRGSHLKKVYRPENIDLSVEIVDTCSVNSGGVMIMRPLLLHASDRTINNNKRRVIHIEFSRTDLPDDLDWSEKLLF